MRDAIERVFQEQGQTHLIQALHICTEEEVDFCWKQLHRFSTFPILTQTIISQEVTSYTPIACRSLRVLPKRGVIILAGGDGSRCGARGVKGMIPLLGKTLFQRICEKIGSEASIAILTSPRNHDAIVRFFQDHSFFRCSDLSFFMQGTMPLLDRTGRWFWESPGRLAEGADGNGSLFHAFAVSGILERWAQEGVELVHIVPIDNPLANPLDPHLASFHLQQEADLSLYAIPLADPLEPMGRVVRKNGHIAIVEFTELTTEQRECLRYANAGLYVCSLSLMDSLAKQFFPIHFVWRSEAWKGERFLTDAVEFARRPHVCETSRESCYAALKTHDSIKVLEQLLLGKNCFHTPS
jgi:UDP-N-acetylglucosamine/UDP-N-acetylgalactosamine diphosphorylase